MRHTTRCTPLSMVVIQEHASEIKEGEHAPVANYVVTIPDSDPPPAEEMRKMDLLSDVCLEAAICEGEYMTPPRMTLREAVHEVTTHMHSPFTTDSVLDAVITRKKYDFGSCKTPKASVTSVLSRDARFTRVDYGTYKINPELQKNKKRKFINKLKETCELPKCTGNPELQKNEKSKFINKLKETCELPKCTGNETTGNQRQRWPQQLLQRNHVQQDNSVLFKRKHISEFKIGTGNNFNINFPRKTYVQSKEFHPILPKPPPLSLYWYQHGTFPGWYF